MKRVIAIDYGLTRVGLAISDPLKLTASPFITLTNNGTQELLQQLVGIIKNEDIETVVVGVPYDKEGNISAMTEKVLVFISQLKEIIDIDVTTYDESYSSQEAQVLLHKSKKKRLSDASHNVRQRYKKRIDQLAASIILQNYLDQLRR